MNSESDDRARTWSLCGLAGLLGLIALSVWWPGCRQYPPVTSRESLQLIKLLYAACNTQEPERLQMAEDRLTKGLQEGKITPPEEKAFRKIIDMAKRGEWKQSEAAAFKFAQDQIGQGSPATVDHHDHHHDHAHAQAP